MREEQQQRDADKSRKDARKQHGRILSFFKDNRQSLSRTSARLERRKVAGSRIAETRVTQELRQETRNTGLVATIGMKF